MAKTNAANVSSSRIKSGHRTAAKAAFRIYISDAREREVMVKGQRVAVDANAHGIGKAQL